MHYVVGIIVACFLWSVSARAAEVDVALGDITINKVPFLIAADTGIYTRNGLAVRQFITPEAAELARRSGVVVPPEIVRANIESAPIAVGGGSPAIYNAVNSGGPHYVVLATLENVVRSHVIATRSIRSMEDLRGKRLGYAAAGRATHIGLLSLAKRMGWTVGRDIILVERASALKDITDGRIDATIGGAVMVALAPEAGLNVLGDVSQYRMPFAGSGVMAERGWLANNRDTAARFVKAAVEAIAVIKRDRATFDAAIVKWFNITDKAARDGMYAEALEFPNKPYPPDEGVRTVMEVYDSPEMRKHRAEDFYDSRFIAELDRSGALDALFR